MPHSLVPSTSALAQALWALHPKVMESSCICTSLQPPQAKKVGTWGVSQCSAGWLLSQMHLREPFGMHSGPMQNAVYVYINTRTHCIMHCIGTIIHYIYIFYIYIYIHKLHYIYIYIEKYIYIYFYGLICNCSLFQRRTFVLKVDEPPAHEVGGRDGGMVFPISACTLLPLPSPPAEDAEDGLRGHSGLF